MTLKSENMREQMFTFYKNKKSLWGEIMWDSHLCPLVGGQDNEIPGVCSYKGGLKVADLWQTID